MGKTPNRIEKNKSQNHINHRAERFANLRVIPPIGYHSPGVGCLASVSSAGMVPDVFIHTISRSHTWDFPIDPDPNEAI